MVLGVNKSPMVLKLEGRLSLSKLKKKGILIDVKTIKALYSLSI